MEIFRFTAEWVRKLDGLDIFRLCTLAALIVAAIVVTLNLPEPATLFVLQAETESIDVTVVQPEAAQVTLARAEVITPKGGHELHQCLDGVVVSAEAGAMVTYARQFTGPLFISVRGPFTWTSAGQEVPKAGEREMQFVLHPASAHCGGPAELRLPANGQLLVGLESSIPPSPDDLFLIKGHLKFYNRSTDRVFGVNLKVRPFTANALYLTSEIDVPPGSRLDGAVDGAKKPAFWAGTIAVNPRDAGMRLDATTTARSVQLWAPTAFSGGDSQRGAGQEPDVISLSFASRISHDPNLLWIYGLVATLFGAMKTMEVLWKKK